MEQWDEVLVWMRAMVEHRLGARAGATSRGQATVEYVLVLVGVATIALLVVAWATNTGKVGDLLNRVFDSMISKIS